MQNQAKTRTQMASEYGVCLKTFNRWLKRENIVLPQGLMCPKDQEIQVVVGYETQSALFHLTFF
jgi:hypothetical protein